MNAFCKNLRISVEFYGKNRDFLEFPAKLKDFLEGKI